MAKRGGCGVGKRYCFTINNWTDADIARLKKIDCKYMVVGVEVGENGTPHLQGYVRFTKQQRFNAAKRQIGQRAHIEAARGNEMQNDEYCRKGGVIALEKGTMNPAVGAKGCKAQATDVIHKLIQQRISGMSPERCAKLRPVQGGQRYYAPAEHFEPLEYP